MQAIAFIRVWDLTLKIFVYFESWLTAQIL